MRCGDSWDDAAALTGIFANSRTYGRSLSLSYSAFHHCKLVWGGASWNAADDNSRCHSFRCTPNSAPVSSIGNRVPCSNRDIVLFCMLVLITKWLLADCARAIECEWVLTDVAVLSCPSGLAFTAVVLAVLLRNALTFAATIILARVVSGKHWWFQWIDLLDATQVSRLTSSIFYYKWF